MRRPAHLDSELERDMEVAKKPSPWPCVVMLAVLIVCSLVAPRYWQSAATNRGTTDVIWDSPPDCDLSLLTPFPNTPPGGSWNASLGQPSIFARGTVSVPWAKPIVDALVTPPTIASPFDTAGRRPDEPFHFGLPLLPSISRSDVRTPPPSPQPAKPDPLVGAAFERIGQSLGRYLPANMFPAVAKRLGKTIPAYFAGQIDIRPLPTAPLTSLNDVRSTLNLVEPADCLPTPPQPATVVPMKTCWCVPKTLYDQLALLGEHPYSAGWASHVGNQLRAVTQRDGLDGDDVRSILADLTSEAERAVQLADTTDDDRLRVELLRAHWALARRLDCWAAIHEEHVALRFQGRVAARGELSPYFDSAPPELPTAAQVLKLGRDLEAYEQSRDPALAHQLVAQQQVLAQSTASFDRAVADAMEQHYRNANVRVAITGELVNRFVQAERVEMRPVADSIAGAFVRGRSEIIARNDVQLSPATDEWNLKVRTQGVVESNTIASSGPVRLRTSGSIDFAGSKTVIVRPDGVHMQSSQVGAMYRSRLHGVTTDFDWVPFVGGMARDRAVEGYRARQGWVREAMETRTADEASETLDRETHEAMERVRTRIYARFTDQFKDHGIKLTTIEMKSSPERLVARMRIASDAQLGSHTPRPRALSDSLASVQLHETALNNMAVTLGLDGQHLTGEELQNKLRERLPRLADREPIEVRRDTVFEFAPHDAVKLRIEEGKLAMQVQFESIELDGDQLPAVTVHVHYVPDVNGLNADLHREGALGIEGRVSAGERARLHNIFKTVFPPDQPMRLVSLEDEERLRGLMITQLVMEDGWIGLAIGPQSPERVAEHARSLR